MSRLNVFVLFALFTLAISQSVALKTTFQVVNENSDAYTISTTDKYVTWGGDLSISDDQLSAVTSVTDTDGDVFFQVNNNDRYCVIDSAENPETGKRVINVMIMQGASCSVSIQGSVATLYVEDSEHDCQWDGSSCVPVKGVRNTLDIVDSDDFTFQPVQEIGYVDLSGDYINREDKTVTTALYRVDGAVFLNVTTADGKSYCLIGSESEILYGEPLSIFRVGHNARCEINKIGYHHFTIQPQIVSGFDCIWNGLDCISSQ
jgi:hypothetical protein